MAAFGSVSTAFQQNSTDLVVTKPTGLAENDLMVAFCFLTGSTTAWTTPSGWTSIRETNANVTSPEAFSVFAKLASAGDAAASNFTFVNSAGGTFTESCVLYRITGTFTGVTNIISSISGLGTESEDDLPVFATGVTPTDASLLVMWSGAFVSNSATSSLSDYAVTTDNPTWTERADFAVSTDEDQRVGSATAARTATTSTGAYQVDYNSSGNVGQSMGALLAIQDTANVNAQPAVVDLTLSVQTPTVTGGATVSPATIDLTLSVQAPTVTTPENTWSTTQKPSTTWTNTSK